MTEMDWVDVLLVEDNPQDAELTLHSLRAHHMANKVFVVEDGADALDFLFATGRFAGRNAQNHPKVVLLDLKLPKIDGLEVLRRIKAAENTRAIPVVVLTSSQEEPDVEESYRLGANSYVVKPVDFEKFARVVADAGMYWLLLNKPPL